MIYASLRFDDGIHVNPDCLQFRGGVLLGVCWQIKVERKRRGSRFAVPEVGFSYTDGALSWVAAFVALSAVVAPTARDFWMFELDVDSAGTFFLSNKVVTFPRAVKVLRICLARSLTEAEADRQVVFRPDQRQEILSAVPRVTMHSCKVTMINAAVHNLDAGASCQHGSRD